MAGHKSRQRWLAERWLQAKWQELHLRWHALREQLTPADWPQRCQRLQQIPDGNLSDWQPRPGSSSAELVLLLEPLSLLQRQWLATLLDAPVAGVMTLVEAVERLHLDLRSQLDPLRSHREYAAQLVILARRLDLPSVAEAAYLENERQIFAALDHLLFASLPMRMRAGLAARHVPGSGAYVGWWQERLLARAGVSDLGLEGLGEHDWPDMPAAWVALGWLCGLRLCAA